MDKDRVKLFNSKNSYDPKLSKTVTVFNEIADYTCLVTNLSNKRQLETFGNLTSADIVVRLLNKDIKNATHLITNNKHFVISKTSVYSNDTVVYAKEVASW
ncbi:hypothetical protein [Macrococcus sp. DPC7161]|uniref:hypothetical protein n=1 Tax=Macrococcus sp. DPC7161 TaxID=2507060 RepID=UPI00100A5BC6|nr:hypothetical protein [Macrococcus sp. DPC7161]RXK19091.1 hypothetical protein ER639_01900 [Macrococcus sp. DPC7161]